MVKPMTHESIVMANTVDPCVTGLRLTAGEVLGDGTRGLGKAQSRVSVSSLTVFYKTKKDQNVAKHTCSQGLKC